MPDEEKNLPEPSAVMTRAEVAARMRLRGMQPVEIAQELHCQVADVGVMVRAHYDQEITEENPEDRESVLNLQVARYEYMMTKLWDQIEYGEVKAILAGMQLVDRIVKLKRLDEQDASAGQSTILVIGGAESDYIDDLKAMVGEDKGNSSGQ